MLVKYHFYQLQKDLTKAYFFQFSTLLQYNHTAQRAKRRAVLVRIGLIMYNVICHVIVDDNMSIQCIVHSENVIVSISFFVLPSS